MFFYNFTNDFKNEYNNLQDQNNYYIDYFNNILKVVNAQKQELLEFMNKITTYIDNATDFEHSDDVLSVLENLKKNLVASNYNIGALKEFSNLLNNIKEILSKINENTLYSIENNDIISLENELQSFNSKLNEKQYKIFQNSLEINQFITNTITKFNLTLPISNTEENNIETITTDNVEDNSKERTVENKITDNNVLIISEKEQKVFLPYLVKDLEKKLFDSKNEYENINQIISNEYILPLNRFSNPILARFRESFKLARKKDKESLQYAFSLAFELSTNFNLHPAIIAACKNLDELDIYLDYLENGETDKFTYFKIIFEMAPTLSK